MRYREYLRAFTFHERESEEQRRHRRKVSSSLSIASRLSFTHLRRSVSFAPKPNGPKGGTGVISLSLSLSLFLPPSYPLVYCHLSLSLVHLLLVFLLVSRRRPSSPPSPFLGA